MTPWLCVEIKTPTWPYLWVKWPTGFYPQQVCARCLRGRFWGEIPFTRRVAGQRFEGELEFAEGEEYAYICGVSSAGWSRNLHLPCRPSPRAKWVVDRPDIRVTARGLARMPMPTLSEEVASLVGRPRSKCRNWIWAASIWPERLAVLSEPPSGEAKPAVRQPTLFDE